MKLNHLRSTAVFRSLILETGRSAFPERRERLARVGARYRDRLVPVLDLHRGLE